MSKLEEVENEGKLLIKVTSTPQFQKRTEESEDSMILNETKTFNEGKRGGL